MVRRGTIILESHGGTLAGAPGQVANGPHGPGPCGPVSDQQARPAAEVRKGRVRARASRPVAGPAARKPCGSRPRRPGGPAPNLEGRAGGIGRPRRRRVPGRRNGKLGAAEIRRAAATGSRRAGNVTANVSVLKGAGRRQPNERKRKVASSGARKTSPAERASRRALGFLSQYPATPGQGKVVHRPDPPAAGPSGPRPLTWPPCIVCFSHPPAPARLTTGARARPLAPGAHACAAAAGHSVPAGDAWASPRTR